MSFREGNSRQGWGDEGERMGEVHVVDVDDTGNYPGRSSLVGVSCDQNEG